MAYNDKAIRDILERLKRKRKLQQHKLSVDWSVEASSYSTNTCNSASYSGVESIQQKLVKMLESDEIKSLMDRLIQASTSKNKAALLLLSKYDKDDNPVKVYITELAKLAIVSLKEKEK